MISFITGAQEVDEDPEIAAVNMHGHPGSTPQVRHILESGDIQVWDEDNYMHSGRKSSELRRVIFEDQSLRRSQL